MCSQEEKMVETLVSSLEAVDKDKTVKISNLVKEMIDTRQAIENAEQEVKKLKAKHESISSEQIPNLMNEMQIDGIKTPHGTIEIAQKYRAYISKANQPMAFAWLRKEGHGSIIKSELKAEFGMGEDKKAQQLLAELQSKGVNPVMKEGVHHSTLSSWVKDMTEKGIDIPDDLFGVYIANETKIK